MTTVSFVEKQCCICHHESRQAEIGLHSGLEPYDLDTRPGGAQRSSMYMWVQCCENCGYCSPDISKCDSDVEGVLQSTKYKQALNNARFPDSLNHFVCWSMLLEATGDFAKAGLAVLYCAWVCDDAANIREHASQYRKEAYRLFEAAQSHGQCFGNSAAEEELIKIDLLRRSGQFGKAEKLCTMQQLKDCDQQTLQILALQQDLIEQKDASSHTISEALEDTDSV
jgi:hypothetical protein